MHLIKPLTTEKAVKLLESENKIAFIVDRRSNKQELKREVEKIFGVKVEKIRTLMRNNKKIVYVRLIKSNPAIDVATKLGMI